MPFEELLEDYDGAEPFCDEARWYRYPLYLCDAPEALRPRCDGDVVVPIERARVRRPLGRGRARSSSTLHSTCPRTGCTQSSVRRGRVRMWHGS
jgi:hypothetical protein